MAITSIDLTGSASRAEAKTARGFRPGPVGEAWAWDPAGLSQGSAGSDAASNPMQIGDHGDRRIADSVSVLLLLREPSSFCAPRVRRALLDRGREWP